MMWNGGICTTLAGEGDKADGPETIPISISEGG
jgi:hypothetical protein